jgi:hypothetical protein
MIRCRSIFQSIKPLRVKQYDVRYLSFVVSFHLEPIAGNNVRQIAAWGYGHGDWMDQIGKTSDVHAPATSAVSTMSV